MEVSCNDAIGLQWPEFFVIPTYAEIHTAVRPCRRMPAFASMTNSGFRNLCQTLSIKANG